MQTESTPIHNYVYSSEMVEFVTAANSFCQLLEQLKDVDGKVFIGKAIDQLSGVYSNFMKLGETDPVFDTPGESNVTEQDWSMVYKQISMLLGPHNDILRLANENEFDRSEIVTHTISEDVADVYQDLKDFSVIYSRGLEELMNDAAWELRERFTEHWGKKLLRSLMALHDLYVAGVDPTEKE